MYESLKWVKHVNTQSINVSLLDIDYSFFGGSSSIILKIFLRNWIPLFPRHAQQNDALTWNANI